MKIFIIILNIIVSINNLYFGILATIPFFIKRKKKGINKIKYHKFLVLIAARNEEIVIGNLIDSINNQNYDKNLYKICVIPNNCQDNTKQIAINKKCIVIEPDTYVKTKGEVLNYAFNYFKDNNDFDTYLILDADNILDKNFMLNINIKLNEGYKIVQGFRDTKNLYDNCISGSYAIFFYIQNLFLYETRTRLNASSTINGTGYVVLKELINDLKFVSNTSTEDIELTCLCALNRIKIGYSRKSVFYDEQVTDFKTSMIQRKRWIQGFIQVFKLYGRDLLNKKIDFQSIDMLNILYLPINQVFCFIALVLSFIFIVPYKYIIYTIITSYIVEVLLSCFLIIYNKKKLNRLISSVLFFPIFHLSWLPIYIYALFNDKNKWEEIKHDKDVKIELLGEKL